MNKGTQIQKSNSLYVEQKNSMIKYLTLVFN
jgi:hypothetical protein